MEKKKKKKNVIEHDYECGICGKPATINIQSVWKKYEIKPNGDFVELDEWEGDTNDFRCDEHEND